MNKVIAALLGVIAVGVVVIAIVLVGNEREDNAEKERREQQTEQREREAEAKLQQEAEDFAESACGFITEKDVRDFCRTETLARFIREARAE